MWTFNVILYVLWSAGYYLILINVFNKVLLIQPICMGRLFVSWQFHSIPACTDPSLHTNPLKPHVSAHVCININFINIQYIGTCIAKQPSLTLVCKINTKNWIYRFVFIDTNFHFFMSLSTTFSIHTICVYTYNIYNIYIF